MTDRTYQLLLLVVALAVLDELHARTRRRYDVVDRGDSLILSFDGTRDVIVREVKTYAKRIAVRIKKRGR